MTTTGYRIAEVTRRTGFSAPTLRYYEDIGLLPAPDRSPAGYREYDERALDRLTFVARAKQLGCSLQEIAGLLSAWESDCEDVYHRLRALVDDKIAAAQRRTTELIALTAQLQQAAAALRQAPGAGPCGPRCACVTTSDGSADVRVEIGTQPEIACTLGSGEPDPGKAVTARIQEWRDLLQHARRRTAIDGGLRVEFDADVPVSELARLAHAEQGCCSFFAFAVVMHDGVVELEVRAPAAGADVVTALFGTTDDR